MPRAFSQNLVGKYRHDVLHMDFDTLKAKDMDRLARYISKTNLVDISLTLPLTNTNVHKLKKLCQAIASKTSLQTLYFMVTSTSFRVRPETTLWNYFPNLRARKYNALVFDAMEIITRNKSDLQSLTIWLPCIKTPASDTQVEKIDCNIKKMQFLKELYLKFPVEQGSELPTINTCNKNNAVDTVFPGLYQKEKPEQVTAEESNTNENPLSI